MAGTISCVLVTGNLFSCMLSVGGVGKARDGISLGEHPAVSRISAQEKTSSGRCEKESVTGLNQCRSSANG